MNSQSFSSLTLIFAIKLFILLQSLHNVSTNPDEFYHTCGNTFSCGDTITRIEYPFRGSNDPPYCGHPGLLLDCDHQKNATTINIMDSTYRVLEIHQATQTMRIVREDIMEGNCPDDHQMITNTTLDYSLFDYASTYTNFTFLFGCPQSNIVPGLSLTACGGVYVTPGTQGPGNCNGSVMVPVLVTANGSGGSGNGTGLEKVVQQGFMIRWKISSKACSDCTESKGRCGYDFESNGTTCFCPDPPYVSNTCPVASGANTPSSGTYNTCCFLTVQCFSITFLAVPNRHILCSSI